MTANTPTTTATGTAAAAISPAAVGTTIRVDPHILTGFHRNPHHGDIGAIMASLIVNGHQCRICWLGHFSNITLFSLLLARTIAGR